MSGTNKRQFIVRQDVDDDVEDLTRFIAKAKRKLRVTVEPYRTNRSLAQNRLAHFWVSVLRKHLLDTTGQVWDHEQLWEAVKRKTLTPKVVPDLETGEATQVYDTHSLTNPEFTDWLHSVEAYCLEKWELQLPHPEDLYDEAQDRREAA